DGIRDWSVTGVQTCALPISQGRPDRVRTAQGVLSPLIRIQTERKQHVVSTGVYGLVRHPMYLGAILMFIGAPLLLGSVYGVLVRSEERRVGKEGRCRSATEH